MNALVVRPISPYPLRVGFAAVIASADGVASLRTVLVCVFETAGLAHGSASRLSSESLRSFRDLPGLLDGVVWASCAPAFVSIDDADSRFSETFAVFN